MHALLERLKQSGNNKMVESQPQKIQQKIPKIQKQQQTQDTLPQDELDYLHADEEVSDMVQPVKILDKSKDIQKKQKNVLSCEKKKKNKKLLGLREPWTDKHQLISIQPPYLNDEKRSKKKYKIKLKFRDPNGKIRNYTVRFGDKNGGDYVDHHNQDKRTMLALRIKNCDSVLNPNFWRVILLNNEFPTINEAWRDFVSSHDFIDIKC